MSQRIHTCQMKIFYLRNYYSNHRYCIFANYQTHFPLASSRYMCSALGKFNSITHSSIDGNASRNLRGRLDFSRIQLRKLSSCENIFPLFTLYNRTLYNTDNLITVQSQDPISLESISSMSFSFAQPKPPSNFYYGKSWRFSSRYFTSEQKVEK